MQRYDHGVVLAGEFAGKAKGCDLIADVHVCGGLVEQEDVPGLRKRAGEENALLFATA